MYEWWYEMTLKIIRCTYDVVFKDHVVGDPVLLQDHFTLISSLVKERF